MDSCRNVRRYGKKYIALEMEKKMAGGLVAWLLLLLLMLLFIGIVLFPPFYFALGIFFIIKKKRGQTSVHKSDKYTQIQEF